MRTTELYPTRSGGSGVPVGLATASVHAKEGDVERTLVLSPQKGNPRNSEGDFIELKDGRLLFVYTRFTGGTDDHASAYLAGRYSADGGRTWTQEDVVVVCNEGRLNIMSVSLLRLPDQRIALFYMLKNSLFDCRPVARFSSDEARTWTEAQEIVPDSGKGYYVLNNGRVVQLKSGRILVPVSRHECPEGRWTKQSEFGTIMCYYSDDGGISWHRSETTQDGSAAKGDEGDRTVLQEPGVVELKDGRVMMFCRTDKGCQYISYSDDKGETWTPFAPSNMGSPLSPASIKRLPASGDLLLVWNDHRHIAPSLRGKRTPLCTAISRDDGATWEQAKVLADNPTGWYCYTAIRFVGEHVLLSYCAGDTRENMGLAVTHVTRLPWKWLYTASDQAQAGKKSVAPMKPRR